MELDFFFGMVFKLLYLQVRFRLCELESQPINIKGQSLANATKTVVWVPVHWTAVTLLERRKQAIG